MCCYPTKVLLVVVGFLSAVAAAAHWDHAVDLDENYRLLWSLSQQDITFEVQARTSGYVGLGFSTDGTIYGADIIIGWVENGQVHFQTITIIGDGNGWIAQIAQNP
uniref:DOMON domain-containing protein n=1 Tax=Anopheles christyi TaxID=43041 RepID=A0A182KH92_9DIPT